MLDVARHQNQLAGEGDGGDLEVGLKPAEPSALQVGFDPAEDPGDY